MTRARITQVELGEGGSVWAVGAVFGEAARLGRLGERLAGRLGSGDALVQMGNLLGGPAAREAVDAWLELAGAAAVAGARVHALRGAQEEMWTRLLQLQFAPEPAGVLGWMVERGAEGTIRAYGGHPDDGFAAIRQGPLAVTHWTMALRDAFQGAGHQPYLTGLVRAASTGTGGVLLVSAGLDPDRPLADQKDAFWWGERAFRRLSGPFEGHRRAVRGFAIPAAGLEEGPHALSVDGGCGRGGRLLAARLSREGAVEEVLEA